MPGEEKQDVEKDFELQKDEKGNFPETVPSTKYIGVKEAYGRAKEKVATLEEQLNNAPNKEEHDKIVKELADKTAELETVKNELNQGKEKTANELREVLRGTKTFSDEELSKMSEAELRVAVKATGSKNPSLPDIAGGGGGSGDLSKLSRTELARQAYSSSNKK